MHSDQMSQSDTSTSSGIRIQYVSDLHLEFPQNRQWIEEHPLEVTGDILLIAGDTAYLDLPDSKNDTYSAYKFWDWASKHYNQVIVCLGNHDFYGYYDLHAMPNGFCKQIRHNIHAYYNSVVHLDGIDIIVSTLWSKIEPYDGTECQRLLSHHVPTQLCTAAEFQNSTINGAFTVELATFISNNRIDYWIYGHSHRNIKAQIGDTIILSNQLGYISHNEHLVNGFNPSAMIEV